VNFENTSPHSVSALRRELAGFKTSKSPFSPEFSLEYILAGVTVCNIVKEKEKRQVFLLKTKHTAYFLKRSTLIKTKDRIRHILVPSRKWAEWRNFHRLRAAEIATAKPVMKGQNKRHLPDVFFLITEKVDGSKLQLASLSEARKLGQFIAYLHSRGVYHADLHPENILIQSDGRACLIDVQQVYVLLWLPRWMRILNLGKLSFHLFFQPDKKELLEEYLRSYNKDQKIPVTLSEIGKAMARHQQRRFRSRTKRCCKNSSEFEIIKRTKLYGYKRRNFNWGKSELQQALKRGKIIKPGRVIAYNGVCIKICYKKFLHNDRCLASWKMSRALEVRGIASPRSLSYFRVNRYSYFLSEFLVDSIHLNDYLSLITDKRQKRRALKKLALWLKNIHDCNVWQKDFKSSNVLCQKGEYFLVDLDGVKIRLLSEDNKIVNLAQLNASISNAIKVRDRLRFYHYYSADDRPSRQQRRAIYQRIWDNSRTKNTFVFDLDMDKLSF